MSVMMPSSMGLKVVTSIAAARCQGEHNSSWWGALTGEGSDDTSSPAGDTAITQVPQTPMLARRRLRGPSRIGANVDKDIGDRIENGVHAG
jgi:hypothetical protein